MGLCTWRAIAMHMTKRGFPPISDPGQRAFWGDLRRNSEASDATYTGARAYAAPLITPGRVRAMQNIAAVDPFKPGTGEFRLRGASMLMPDFKLNAPPQACRFMLWP
jgi:hypothetical protein